MRNETGDYWGQNEIPGQKGYGLLLYAYVECHAWSLVDISIEFADFRRKLENNFRTEDIRQWLQIFHKTLEDLQKDVKGIREKIKP